MADSSSLSVLDLRQITVRTILHEEEGRWNALMRTHHYLGFRSLVGVALKYVAIQGWGAAAFKCGDRDRWIGLAPSEQFRRLRYIANNQRFLILPATRTPHLASRVLGLSLGRLSSDWVRQFNHPILLVETFEIFVPFYRHLLHGGRMDLPGRDPGVRAQRRRLPCSQPKENGLGPPSSFPGSGRAQGPVR